MKRNSKKIDCTFLIFCIILISICLILFWFISKKECFENNNKNKIAIYSCNFGNYRNELKDNIDNIEIDNNIDYYFFTDNKNLTSNKWNIIYPLKIPGDEIMDTNRWTSKYIKLKKHDNLKKYDIIVWCDNKVLNKSKGFLNYSNIIDTLSNKDLVFLKHPTRKTIQEELIKTIQIKKENDISGKQFLNEIKNKIYNFPLVDTAVVIIRNNKKNSILFEEFYNTLKQKKLKRDQNVISYVIDQLSYSLKNIKLISYDRII